jgi:hypothetical protein
MVKGVTALVCASALAVTLIAAPAPATEVTFNVKVAKHKDGPYEVDIKSHIDPGATRSFWFRVKNTGDQESQLIFDDSGTSDGIGFKTKWFKAGENVSNEVEGMGYEFNIAPGQRKYFNAKQTGLDAPGAVEECLAGQARLQMITSDLSSVQINGATCAF